MNRKHLYISPIVSQRRAVALLLSWGLPAEDQPFTDKPIRIRGKRRRGQHRGHRCSMTSAPGSKAKG